MKIKLLAAIFVCFLAIFLFIPVAHTAGQEITIAYTGNTYANLYPCEECPASVGGGLARRAVILDKLGRNKNLIILDSGNFTASGPGDKDSLNPHLDSKRSRVCYEAMSDMGYMYAGIGENELAFGRKFLETAIKENKFNFLSANLDIQDAVPYAIKRFPDVKVAIIGLSPLSINQLAGLKVKSYEESLTKALKELREKADIFILISPLSESETVKLIKQFPQIKFAFTSGALAGSPPYEEAGSSVIFRPAYRGRTLRAVTIELEGHEVKGWKFNEERLPLNVKGDSKIKKLLPDCFKNSDCSRKKGMLSRCENPGGIASSCAYYEAKKIGVTVITDKKCSFCSIEPTEKLLNSAFLGLNLNYIDYNSPEAGKIMKKYKIETLPAFIFDSGIEKDNNFKKFRNFFTEIKGKFILGRQISGVFLFPKRKEIPGRIDYFFDFYEKNSAEIYSQLSGFAKGEGIRLETHFIVSRNQKAPYAQEEADVAIALGRIYPGRLREYIKLRTENINDESWITTLDKSGVDYTRIKRFTASKKMKRDLKKNNSLIEELKMRDGNVLLINNRMILKVFKIDKDELGKLFTKKD